MPTSFQAFMMRDGVPRTIPDRGTYWHFGQEVATPVNRPAPVTEHPDLLYDRGPRRGAASPGVRGPATASRMRRAAAEAARAQLIDDTAHARR
jgi:hypothetical protein